MSNNGGTQQKSSVTEKAQKAVQKAQKAKQRVQNIKKVAHAIKNISSAGPLMYVLFWVFVVIVAIIIITGIIMFLVTMPGMIMDKLNMFFQELGHHVAAFFGADTTGQIDEVKIYETLDYIEDMGWDLKGEGFLTSYYKTGDEVKVEEKLEDEDIEAGYDIDDKQGVVRNSNGDIILADSDFIFTYVMSDNYVYTLKNENIATQMTNAKGADWLDTIGRGAATAFLKLENLIYGPLLDVLGVTGDIVDKWGKGLIAIYYDDGLGIEDRIVNEGSMWDWTQLKIDIETKKLSIVRNNLFNANNNAMEYSLDGWTGRYGMPLEFLLSVQKATMMPDLAMDMVSNFPTEIHLLLHKTSGESVAAYRNDDGNFVEWAAIREASTGIEIDEGWKWLRSLVAEIVDWFVSPAAKVQAARIAGVNIGVGSEVNPKCSCKLTGGYCDSEGYALDSEGKKYAADAPITGYDEDGNPIQDHKAGDSLKDGRTAEYHENEIVEEACPYCWSVYQAIDKKLGDATDYYYITYAPYISEVSDHWYRDVYYVLNSGKKLVEYDYDYEAVMKERWTLYETYPEDSSDPIYSKIDATYNADKVGEFIIYLIGTDGNYIKDASGKYKVYDGTFEEARGGILYALGDNGDYVMYTGVVDDNGKAMDAAGNEIKLYLKAGKDQNGADKFQEYNKGDTIAVSKKARTISSSDTDALKDLGWEKASTGVWTAYEEDDTVSGYNPLFEAADIEKETDEITKYVMSNTYINLNINKNIVQVGEGQRAETNSTIKKMFLVNKYFRYDGSVETAEIITALRTRGTESKDDDIAYGDLNESELNKTVVVDGKTYKARDYAGTVLLNQDSLNAFSMLENTHTLDADFIYRDFKELVVELGYFEKEEITDESPRLLQFPIPQIGSAGFPDRTIDKREVIEGTMIHSKHDIEANRKYTLKAIVKNATNEGAPSEDMAKVEIKDNRFNKPVTLASSRVNNNRLQLNALEFNLTEVGAIENIRKPEQIPLNKFIEANNDMCEFINEKGYNYCVMRKPGAGRDTGSCTCTSDCVNGWLTNLKCVCRMYRGSL